MTTKKKPVQYDKDVKKFGTPKFKDGDKVVVLGFEKLTIKGDAWCNGFAWMYSFHDSDMSAGQEYIKLQN